MRCALFIGTLSVIYCVMFCADFARHQILSTHIVQIICRCHSTNQQAKQYVLFLLLEVYAYVQNVSEHMLTLH